MKQSTFFAGLLIVGGAAIYFFKAPAPPPSVDEFSGVVSLSADGVRYSAESLVGTASEMNAKGISPTDINELIRLFVRKGIPQAEIGRTIEMTLKLSKILDTSAFYTGEKISDALTGGVDDVREFDREINFLSADEYEAMTKLEKSGKSSDAMVLAKNALARKLGV